MSRRVRRLPVRPAEIPVQLVLGLEGGRLSALGKTPRGRKYVPGGSFPSGKAAAVKAA